MPANQSYFKFEYYLCGLFIVTQAYVSHVTLRGPLPTVLQQRHITVTVRWYCPCGSQRYKIIGSSVRIVSTRTSQGMKAGSSPISQRLDGGFDRQYIEYIKLVNAGPRHLHTLVLTAKDFH